MPRRVQDIIPSEKRSIRNIPLHNEESSRNSRSREKETEIRIHKPNSDRPVGNLISLEEKLEVPEKKRRSKKSSSNKGLLIFLGSLIIFAGLGYFASQVYAVAKFDIIPKSYPVNVNKTVVAQSSSSNNGLTYQVITLKDEMELSVPSTDGAYEESKATGKVIIYNDYSTASQRLIAGTRLSGSSGLVYKLSSSITVPGKTSKGAGQITVSVVAEKAGQEYNTAKSSGETLRLLGFKGTPKYEGFYAKLSTDIIGGFAGKKKIISKDVMSSSTKFLSEALNQRLLARISEELSDDQLLFEKGIIYSTTTPKISGNDALTSTITLGATINAIIFDKTELMKRLAGEEIINSFGEYSFDVVNMDNLSVAFTNLKDFSVTKKNSITVNFEGSAIVVAKIPIDEIKSRLMGKPMSETQELMRIYSPIISPESKGQVMPPWSKVPTNVDNINIRVQTIK
jgi:hypothetical protein